MRREFEKLGYTTNYLRTAWVIVFVCQTILIIMGAAGLNNDDFKKIMIIYILNEVFLVIMSKRIVIENCEINPLNDSLVGILFVR